MSADIRALGESIRAARMRKGLTQEALAELLDITPIHLKNMESSRRNPSVPLLFALMELLDLSVDALVFPERQEGGVLHTHGLSDAEVEALARLVDVMRQEKGTRVCPRRPPAPVSPVLCAARPCKTAADRL